MSTTETEAQAAITSAKKALAEAIEQMVKGGGLGSASGEVGNLRGLAEAISHLDRDR